MPKVQRIDSLTANQCFSRSNTLILSLRMDVLKNKAYLLCEKSRLSLVPHVLIA